MASAATVVARALPPKIPSTPPSGLSIDPDPVPEFPDVFPVVVARWRRKSKGSLLTKLFSQTLLLSESTGGKKGKLCAIQKSRTEVLRTPSAIEVNLGQGVKLQKVLNF